MMHGWAALWQQPTKESSLSGLDYFQRAIKIDPQNPEAMVGFGYARLRAFGYGWNPTEDSWAAQLELLTRATAISPGYAFAHYVRSQLLFFVGQLPQAIEAAQTAVALGLTITVARQQSKTVSELSFLMAVHTAKGIAKQEGIPEIFVCTAMTPWPTPTIPDPPAGRTSPV